MYKLARVVCGPILAVLALTGLVGGLLPANALGQTQEEADRIAEMAEAAAAEASESTLDRGWATKEDRAAYTRITRVLDTREVSVHFSDTDFLDAVAFLREVSALNIVVSPGLKDRLEAEQTTLTLRLKGIRVRNCLELMLTFAGDEVVYGVKHGVLYLTLTEEWPKRMIMRVIPLGEFHEPPDYKAPKAGLGKIGDDD
ncbi:MAG: hypothetical protein ACYTFT_12120 [Planctomycetota bacterium]|jgi:hypothetical protein